MKRQVTRRRFLVLSGSAAGVGLLAACATPAQPAPTQAPKAAEPTPVKPAAQVPSVPQLPVATAAATTAPTQAPAATKAAGTPKTGGTFTMAKTQGIDDFNPMNIRPGHFAHMRAAYNTLAHYDDNLNLQPELAEKWAFTSDGKTFTINLRQGVKFHSGREFTSADVKATWEFCTTNEWVTLRSMYKNITAVETPDKYTAVFKFNAVFPGTYDIMDTMYIIDKETSADLNKTAIGTGPFKLDKYVPNDRAEFVPNKDYWEKGKPYLDRYVIRFIPDVSTLAINLESGAVDCIWQPSWRDLPRLGAQSGGKYIVDMGTPGANMYDIAINTKWEQFADKRVRQAVAWSIDRARFAKNTLVGMVEPTNLMWPNISWGYQKDMEGKIGYNLEKAKDLLKQAGFDKGFDAEMIMASKSSYGLSEMGQMLQADLAKIGINGKLTDLETQAYQTRLQQKKDWPIAIHTYGRCNRDPGSLLTGAIAYYPEKDGGWTRLENAEYDKLRVDVNTMLEREKRVPLLRRVQEIWLDECATNVVAPQQRPWSYASYVKGFALDHDNSPFIAGFWLEK
ncbi:MAG: ABC transporter substrate-binding protein [Chloroflexota bacterium]